MKTQAGKVLAKLAVDSRALLRQAPSALETDAKPLRIGRRHVWLAVGAGELVHLRAFKQVSKDDKNKYYQRTELGDEIVALMDNPDSEKK